jgi:CubicO group peptidase (beta-lactamase class C family)
MINSSIPQTELSGCILISTNQKIIYENCLGYADFAKKIPVTTDTQFLIGSVTKQFAGVAITKALWDKKVKDIQAELNKPIAHYLPSHHALWNGAMPAWANTITLHHLLVHSSGIVNYNSLPGFNNQKFTTSSDIISYFKNHPLEFTSGEKFAYCNSGYFLLGEIIQDIAQESLDLYLEKIFFAPFKMNSTHFPMQGTVDDLIKTDSRFKKLARGYQYDIAKKVADLSEISHYEPMNVPGAGGSLISTAEDLLKWNNALYAGEIVPKSLLELILKPYLVTELGDSYYGYGIEIMKSATGNEYYSHRGGIPGFRSILTYLPDSQTSIIMLQNIVSNDEFIIPIAEKLKTSLTPTELVKTIEAQYPTIPENRKRFELVSLYDDILQNLVSMDRI